jgi:ATP-dependent DNA ligase
MESPTTSGIPSLGGQPASRLRLAADLPSAQRRADLHPERAPTPSPVPELSASLAQLPAGTVLDGELVCLEPLPAGRVRCRFDRLGGFHAWARAAPPDGLTVTLVAFDALAIAGAHLRAQRWHERRKQLERLQDGAPMSRTCRHNSEAVQANR